MRHNGWKALGGADADGTQRYGLIGFDGNTIHGWVQSVKPGEATAVGYATADLDAIEADFKEAATLAGGDISSFIGADAELAAELGLFGIGKALKKLAKKTGISKVLKKASKLADYALSNPLVKGALAATGPMGMSVLAAHQGYKILRRYKAGSKKAISFVKNVVSQAQKGNPRAIKIQRMLRMGQRAFGPGAISRYAVRRRGTAARYGTRKWGSRYRPVCPRGRVSGDLEVMAGADVVELDVLFGRWMGGAGAGVAYMGQDVIMGQEVIVGEEMIIGQDAIFGADADAATDQDIADLNEFAASAGAWEGITMLGDDLGIGAWEGLAWAADRLGLHSMAARPQEMSARDALLDGRQGQAARFA